MSDDERREVAERLRGLRRDANSVTQLNHGPTWSLAWCVLGDGLDECGTGDWFERMCARLADLIEPSCDRDTPQKVAEEMFGKMRHSTKEEADAYDAMLKSKSIEVHPVDREALLALEDEMFEDAIGLALVSQLEKNEGLQDLQSTMAKALMDYARRIREALGVSGDE